MLRITVESDAASVTFRLEGRLAGSWVQELHDCWQRTFAASPKPSVRFDLSDVTYIDAAGKEFLAARYREGHKLIAAGCLMKFIVAEITSLPAPVTRTPDVQAQSVM
jgi:anti-anti-sigma regulatory factor